MASSSSTVSANYQRVAASDSGVENLSGTQAGGGSSSGVTFPPAKGSSSTGPPKYQKVASSESDADYLSSRSLIADGSDPEKASRPPGGILGVLRSNLFLSCCLIFIPFGFVSHFRSWPTAVVFSCNFMSILPMAWLIGKTTEDLATYTGEIAGGLINATFGNIVEMLLCVAGIQQNQLSIVQCTLVGSILSNILLVLGTSFLWGGYHKHEQSYSQAGAGTHSSLMLLSLLGLVLPTTYHEITPKSDLAVLSISRGLSVMLLVVYAQYLYFELSTHADLFECDEGNVDDDEEEEVADLSAPVAASMLAVCTVLTACCSEYLISSIEGTIETWNVSREFLGIIVMPIIGNAAEHYTAIVVAGRDKMDLSLGVAVGSSCQMAMLVTPFCVLVGWFFDRPMSLDFHPFQVMVLVLSVLMVCNVISDGKSNWLEGSLLITAYGVIALIYFFTDMTAAKSLADE